VHEALEEARNSFPGRELHFSPAGDGLGAWDRDRLLQVVHNLVTNALKYSPDGTTFTVRLPRKAG
jgi:signal transduction histidine kinase